MARRSLTAITATAGGLALVLHFKSADSATPVVAAAAASAPAAGTAGTASSSPSGTSTSSTTAVAPSTATTQGGLRDGTITGPVISTRWGDVQVQVTVANGVITDVQALQLPSGHSRSNQLSQYAPPILREEALTAQSASIDTVSGATYTSNGYVQSLQAALDQLGG